MSEKHAVSQRETWEYIKSKPDDLERTIVLAVSQGSTLRRIASNFGIPFSWLYEHVNGDPGLLRKYEIALSTRSDYMKDFLFDQFHQLASDETMRDMARIKALENLAKHFNFTVDKETDQGKLTWEAIIMLAMKRENEVSAARPVVEASIKEDEKE